MFEKIDIIYKKTLDYLIITIFTVMLSITIINVILRFVFNNPISWSTEFARYSFVWIIFLGASLAMRNGSHIGLEFLASILPEKSRKYLKLFIMLLILLFLLIFTFVSFKMALDAVHTNSSAMQIPMLIPYLALPIGGIAMIVELTKIVKLILKNDNGDNPKHKDGQDQIERLDIL